MAERRAAERRAERRAAERGANPLARDSELFYGYMGLLDEVLGQAEIRAALTDQNLSSNQVRMRCSAASAGVLREATSEYAAYEAALGEYERTLVQVKRREHRDAGDRVLRTAALGLGVAGAATILLALLVGLWWSRARVLWQPGLGMLVVAGAAFAVAIARFTELGIRLLGGEAAGAVAGELDRARQALLDAVGRHHLLAFVRAAINDARRSALGTEFAVAASPGLSEVYDSAYHVTTTVTAEVEELLGWMDGGSIGVAGPRGSGKSTLVLDYCQDPGHPSGDLRCMVAAPVDYVARDFTLHLFAAFCRTVRARLSRGAAPESRTRVLGWADAAFGLLFCTVIGGILLIFKKDVAEVLDRPPSFVAGLAGALLAYGGVVAVLELAKSHWTDERRRPAIPALWVGAVLDVGRAAAFWAAVGAGLIHFRADLAEGLDRPERQIAYAAWAALGFGLLQASVRLVRAWRRARSSRAVAARKLAATAARNLRRVRYLQTDSTGWTGMLKLPFGLEGGPTLNTQRAEQPLSYPEIVDEFRRFARQVAGFLHEDGNRVFIGVDELDKIGSAAQAEKFLNEIKGIFGIPYVYFLVSVSDDALTAFERRGLPLRDAFDSSFAEIIRVEPLTYLESRRLIYRRVIGLTEPYIALCHCMSGGMARDLIRFARQVVRAGQRPGSASRTDQAGPAAVLAEICATVLSDEARRQLRAAAQVIASMEGGAPAAGPLLERLYAIAHRPGAAAGKPTAELIAELAAAAPAAPDTAVVVHRDLLAHLYLCTTVAEVFGGHLDEPRMLWATAQDHPHPGHFDSLATARLALARSAQVAWRLIDDFRTAWTLTPLPAPAWTSPPQPAEPPAAAPPPAEAPATPASRMPVRPPNPRDPQPDQAAS